jgi:hypothetical protein
MLLLSKAIVLQLRQLESHAWMAEKLFGHSTAAAFGYSHLTGGFAGG